MAGDVLPAPIGVQAQHAVVSVRGDEESTVGRGGEVVAEVGKDVFRFIMLTRRNDQALDFDFAKVTEQSRDNPVFYVQYAHARAASVMRHAAVCRYLLDLHLRRHAADHCPL